MDTPIKKTEIKIKNKHKLIFKSTSISKIGKMTFESAKKIEIYQK